VKSDITVKGKTATAQAINKLAREEGVTPEAKAAEIRTVFNASFE